MKLVRFAAGKDGPRIGWLEGKCVLDLSRALQAYWLVVEGRESPLPRAMLDLLRQGLAAPEFLGKVRQFVSEHRLQEAFTVGEHRLLSPIEAPGKIVALGRNYAAHALEHARTIPSEPIIFGKAPSSVIGPEEPVVYKPWLSRVDPEVEIAFVIGRGGADIPRERAAEHIAGWTVVNDVTARDMQSADIEARQPWWRSKSLDTFCPLGPCLVLPDEISLPVARDLELRVNGEIRQHDNTASMLFPPDVLVEFISRHMRLDPGDLVCTGTPEGMKPVFPGDVMEATVEGIGTLRNPVVAG